MNTNPSISVTIKNLNLIMPKDSAPPAVGLAPAFSGNVERTIDIRQPPRMIKLSETGGQLPDDATGHTMVLLSDFGLIFDAREPTMADNWGAANSIAEATALPGNDWRLPQREELQLLIAADRFEPAINTHYFPHTPTNDWYWTATRRASSPAGYAWCVLFGGGNVNDNHQGYSGFVRACRRVSPGQ